MNRAISNSLGDINLVLDRIKPDSKNKISEIYVDNLHFPYVVFPEKYILPPFRMDSINSEDLINYVKVLVNYLPEALLGTSLLPESKPVRDEGKLFFVKDFECLSKKYLYILKVDSAYLGGANNEDIIQPTSQGVSPSIRTDRAYCSVRIIPIESVKKEGNRIIDFFPAKFNEGVFTADVGGNERIGPKRTITELFDEVDFSHLIEKIQNRLGVNSSTWHLGKVYNPIAVEYLTPSIRFLNFSQLSCQKYYTDFADAIQCLLEEKEVSGESKEKINMWLDAYHCERLQSDSGNMRWKITHVA